MDRRLGIIELTPHLLGQFIGLPEGVRVKRIAENPDIRSDSFLVLLEGDDGCECLPLVNEGARVPYINCLPLKPKADMHSCYYENSVDWTYGM